MFYVRTKISFQQTKTLPTCEYYGIKLGENILESMKTPSYPSGILTQGTLVGKVLQTKLPINIIWFRKVKEFLILVILEPHLKSDSVMGENIGPYRMYEYIIHKI